MSTRARCSRCAARLPAADQRRHDSPGVVSEKPADVCPQVKGRHRAASGEVISDTVEEKSLGRAVGQPKPRGQQRCRGEGRRAIVISPSARPIFAVRGATVATIAPARTGGPTAHW